MLHHPNFNPVAIDLGFAQIHWYGLMYMAAFAFAYWISKRLVKVGRAPVTGEQVEDAIFYGAMGLILGARIGYVFFYGFDRFVEDPLWLFKIWTGGMSFHGGLIGVFFAALLFSRKHKVALGDMVDLAAVACPLGLGFGRIGNFIGQELWGRPSNVPWAMVFPNDPSGLARHPSQLYQAFFEGLLLFTITYCFYKKPRPRWSTAALFVVCYGCFRFMVEFFRQPDSHIGFDLFGWMSRGQLLSIPMVLIGIGVMIWAYYADKQKNAALAGMTSK